jgi:heme exporter protein D
MCAVAFLVWSVVIVVIVWVDVLRNRRRLRELARRDRMIAKFEAAQNGAAAHNGRAAGFPGCAGEVEPGGASNDLLGGTPAGPEPGSDGDRAGVDPQAEDRRWHR